MRAPRIAQQDDGLREAGFTLLELLVSLTLLALLVPLILNGLRYGMRVWQQSDSVRQEGDIQLARNFLRERIASAYPAFIDDDPTEPHVDFTGAGDRLEFLAPTPDAAGGAAESRFVLRLADGETGGNLVMSWQPRFGDIAALGAAQLTQEAILATRVAKLDIDYYGALKKNASADWFSEWNGLIRLPMLVRIRLRFVDGDHRSWPDMTVAPLRTIDTDCGYDPVSRGCRGRP